MKYFVILIALQLLPAAYIECTSNVVSKEITGSSEVSGSQRSEHNRNHILGNTNWANDERYKYNVMILWQLKAEKMKIKKHEEIGKIKDQMLHYKCSGIVVNPHWVVTAASCFQPKIRQLGKLNGIESPFRLPDLGFVMALHQNRSIDIVTIHKDYAESSRRGDIDVALVKVAPTFETNPATPSHVNVARIGENIPYSPTLIENGMKECVVMSYGQDAVTAEPPFTQKLTMYDVRAAGPKFCETQHRAIMAPWYNSVNPQRWHNEQEDDFYDSFFICTIPDKWHWRYDGVRPQANEEGLGCFGGVGGSLTCDDWTDIVLGVQAQRFEQRYCHDNYSYSGFTSLGDPKVYDWIKTKIPSIGPVVNIKPRYIRYPYKDHPTRSDDNDTHPTPITSSMATVSTCGEVILSLALTFIAFTF